MMLSQAWSLLLCGSASAFVRTSRCARRCLAATPPDSEVARVRRPRYAGKYPRQFDMRHKELGGDAATIAKVAAKGSTPAGTHVAILPLECLAHLGLSLDATLIESPAPRPEEEGDALLVVDCTLGYGGHSGRVLDALRDARRGGGSCAGAPPPTLLALDQDATELAKTTRRLRERPDVATTASSSAPPPPSSSSEDDQRTQFECAHANFARLAEFAGPASPARRAAHAILADLGCSSMQVDDPQRGFTYKQDGPLDMRMDPSGGGETAADWLARQNVTALSAVLRDNADFEKDDARQLARALLLESGDVPRTTQRLAEIVRGFSDGLLAKLGAKQGDKRAAANAIVARVMQAVRIEVNSEFAALDALLAALPNALAPNGRTVVLTFHSGEDRRVKKAFKRGLATGVYSEIARRPVRASQSEINANPRASCCKLRWAVKAPDPNTGSGL